MRYPVENILELLSSGMSIEEILEDYKDLEREDILAHLNSDATRLGADILARLDKARLEVHYPMG